MTPLAKYRVKRVLQRLGIAPRRLRPARRDLGEVCRHLRRCGFDPGTVIDVGVADGTFEIYTAFPDARLLLVEPMGEFKPALASIAARYDARYLIAAASDHTGEIRIHYSPHDLHGSSMMIENALAAEQRTRTVACIRLDDWVGGEPPPPYLVKLDTQGSELRVLDGARDVLERTEAVIVETSFYRFKSDAPLFHEVVEYMKDREFVVYDIFGGYLRPLDRALAQVDVVFVRENGMFRRAQDFSRHAARPGDAAIARMRRALGV